MSDAVTINLGLILLISCIVTMISGRMHLPYSVGLVVAGIMLRSLEVSTWVARERIPPILKVFSPSN